MFDDMYSAFEEETFPQLTNGYYLRLHLIIFLFLIPFFTLAAYRGPISFSLDGAMGIWGAALMGHALWTFLRSGLYDHHREDAIQRMIDREMRSTSLSPRDEALMMKVLDYDARKAAKPLQPVIRVAFVSGFLSLLIWLMSEIRQPGSGPDFVGYTQLAYIGYVLVISYLYRNELFLSPIKRGFAKSKRFIQRSDTTPNEHKLKRLSEPERADNSAHWDDEEHLEEDHAETSSYQRRVQ